MISVLLQTINRDALPARVEALRNRIKCTLEFLTAGKAYFNFDILGGRNYHGSLVFEDGKTWLARSKLTNHVQPPIQERNFDRRSEFAIYSSLASARALVPVLGVYGVADDKDSKYPVGDRYISFQKLPAKPLAWHEANDLQKERFSRQLGEIYISLGLHHFNKLGRLQLSPTREPEVGPAFFEYGSENLTPFTLFDNSDDYYTVVIQQNTYLIKDSTIITTVPLDQYLIYKTPLDHLPPNDPGPFVLRHVDSRDVNFLADEQYNITGIIRWELVAVTSKG